MNYGVSIEKAEPPGSDVFLSFATRHKALVDKLREQAETSCSALRFHDYAIEKPIDGGWRLEVERLIRVSAATLCLIGDTTWQSEPVNWEIRKSAELGKRVLAVYLHPEPVRVPAALTEIGVTPIPFNVNAIVSELNG